MPGRTINALVAMSYLILKKKKSLRDRSPDYSHHTEGFPKAEERELRVEFKSPFQN